MTDSTAPAVGLDALVEAAMQRKIVPTQQEAAAASPETLQSSAPTITPVPQKKDAPLFLKKDEPTTVLPDRAPDVSLPFMVNGVKCLVAIYVEPGGKVSVPGGNTRATKSGPTVKGVRGRTEPTSEAPEASGEGFPDVLPDRWENHPVVGASPIPGHKWECPEHKTSVVRKSQRTGRSYIVCGTAECSQVAPI